MLLKHMADMVKPLLKKPVNLPVVKHKPITVSADAVAHFNVKPRGSAGSAGGLNLSNQRKMDQGQIPIDISIDLHGMRTDQAFSAFEQAIDRAYSQQMRFMLVITGKGRNSSTPEGVLRTELPRWLKLPHISGKIIRASQATRQHGGDGAFYILIKRMKP